MIYLVPTGLLINTAYIFFYQYSVPPGLSRQGQYIGRPNDKIGVKVPSGTKLNLPDNNII